MDNCWLQIQHLNSYESDTSSLTGLCFLDIAKQTSKLLLSTFLTIIITFKWVKDNIFIMEDQHLRGVSLHGKVHFFPTTIIQRTMCPPYKLDHPMCPPYRLDHTFCVFYSIHLKMRRAQREISVTCTDDSFTSPPLIT